LQIVLNRNNLRGDLSLIGFGFGDLTVIIRYGASFQSHTDKAILHHTTDRLTRRRQSEMLSSYRLGPVRRPYTVLAVNFAIRNCGWYQLK